MSEQLPVENGAPNRRDQIRLRVDHFRQARQHGMIGVPEIVGLIGSGVMVLAVAFAYFYFLTPARARLKASQAEQVRLQNRIRSAEEGLDPNASAQSTVEEINQSLVTFERDALMQRNQGRMDLYGHLNDAMRKNGLRNTAGPVYTSLEELGAAGAAKTTRSGNARWQSLYPGIGIAVTVEGPYANIRRFVREIEASRQFVIINAVELEGVTEGDSTTGANLVSLHLDMATYFQRGTPAADTGTNSESR